MTELHRSAVKAMAQHVKEAGVPSGQWTDNVARAAAVVKRHPEVAVEWPMVTLGGYRASWPGGEVAADSAAELADALEREFPE